MRSTRLKSCFSSYAGTGTAVSALWDTLCSVPTDSGEFLRCRRRRQLHSVIPADVCVRGWPSSSTGCPTLCAGALAALTAERSAEMAARRLHRWRHGRSGRATIFGFQCIFFFFSRTNGLLPFARDERPAVFRCKKRGVLEDEESRGKIKSDTGESHGER